MLSDWILDSGYNPDGKPRQARPLRFSLGTVLKAGCGDWKAGWLGALKWRRLPTSRECIAACDPLARPPLFPARSAAPSLRPLPPVNHLLPCVRHLPFYERLAVTDASSDAWDASAASLHALRLVDAWCRGSRRGAALSKREVRAVARYVKGARGAIQSPFLRVVEAIAAGEPHAEDIVGRALLEHARALRLEMEWQLAVDVCQTVVEQLAQDIDPALLLEAMAQWAVSLRLVGRFDEARRRYVALRRRAKHLRNIEYVAWARIGLANILLDRGNFPGAQSAIGEVIADMRTSAEPRLRGMLSRALHTRANIANARGRPSEALPVAYEALDLCHDPIERESILHDIAVAFMGVGCLAAARDALVLLRRTAMNHAVRWSASVNLMEIAALEGRAESFESWRRDLADQRLRPCHRVHFLCLAGEGYERLGQYKRAVEMYAEAVSAGEALGINEVVIRAEARAREVCAKRYLPARVVAVPVSHDVEDVIEAVAELRMAAGIPAGAENP